VKRVRATLAAGLAAAATVVAASPASAQTAPSCVPGTIAKDKISFQLYNFLIPVFGAFPLGDGTFFPPGGTPNTPEQMRTAVRNVFTQMSANGYRSFENFNGTFGWTPAEYRNEFESRGLHAVADHGTVDEGSWDARLEQAQALGLKYVGSGGWPAGTNMNTVEGAKNMGAVLNRLGTKARAKGLWVYGHNHDAEFATKLQYDVNGDGVNETVPAIEVVMLNTDPSLVTFEIDVHWALEGLNYNQDALEAFLRKYSKRISMLHVKGSDPTKNPSTIPSTDFARITDAGGPNDVTDWKRIFAAAADVDYYHWEYDMSADAFASSKVASQLLNCITFGKVRDESGGVGGTVPATLSLTLGGAASFGSFAPGVAREYTASTTANVISSAGDATLTYSDPGRLTNGAFSLAQPLQVSLSKSVWNAPVSNDAVTIGFKQAIGANEALRTGNYSKTLTFTLSTTTP
jgi:sugar phosphate isomerase/epimerase